MGLRMGSINAEDGGAIVGKEKAGKWALGALLERLRVLVLNGW